jgi:hypothetical protein
LDHLYKTKLTWDRRTNVNPDLGTDCNAAPLEVSLDAASIAYCTRYASGRKSHEAVKDLDHHRSPMCDTIPFPACQNLLLRWLVRQALVGDGRAMMRRRICLGEYHHLSRVTSSRSVVWKRPMIHMPVLCGVSVRGCVGQKRSGQAPWWLRRAVAIKSICFRLVPEKESGGTVVVSDTRTLRSRRGSANSQIRTNGSRRLRRLKGVMWHSLLDGSNGKW